MKNHKTTGLFWLWLVGVALARCQNVAVASLTSVHWNTFRIATRRRLRLHGRRERRPGDDNSSARQIVRDYLERTPVISEFYIQGWRWHTMSLIRESQRLSRAAAAAATASALCGCAELQVAAKYVVQFNMKGLHQTETKVFMPWIRKRLLSDIDAPVRQALTTILDDLDHQRTRVQQLGVKMMQDLEQNRNSSVSKTAAEIASECRSMLQIADGILVPWVQRNVPKSQQERFNNRVIANMGLLDSRLHLTGMYEAVEASSSNEERATFRRIIPKFTQRMIPRWKRLLNDPKVQALHQY